MISLLIGLAGMAAEAPAPVAALRVDGERSEWMMRVDGSLGAYRLTIDCIRGCPAASHREEDVQTPLGLFRLGDDDNLVFGLFASGAAYWLRAWSISDDGLERVLMTASRGRPDFAIGAEGTMVVRTYERPRGAAGRETSVDPQPVTWRFENGRFVRMPEGGR